MAGVIYVLSNPAMPGLIKIGKTTNDDPKVRMGQLYTTGVPVPFECEYAVEVNDPGRTERALHQAFAPQRINPSREFFQVEVEQVRAILELIGERDVTPAEAVDNSEVDEASQQAAAQLRRASRTSISKRWAFPSGRSWSPLTAATAPSSRVRGGWSTAGKCSPSLRQPSGPKASRTISRQPRIGSINAAG